MRRWLARLVSAEVRRLTAERDRARTTRAEAIRVALLWHAAARRRQDPAMDRAAEHNIKESTWQ
ncbi:hypothetical protein FJK98_02305 [Micromonospora sp. HM134]|uniref:hypothetical protein n=1 Tax=Micromonospora sp. HM134 TaxID=2583243 RepID=UPI001198347E|nr:hypothetical protein [Micromonospora sp. HM134]QDY06137.1 hypothetical protein FJK98_02305 [Micromonospora sp. HM134]